MWTVEPRVVELAWQSVTNRHVDDGVGDPSATVGNALPGDGVMAEVGEPACVKLSGVEGAMVFTLHDGSTSAEVQQSASITCRLANAR